MIENELSEFDKKLIKQIVGLSMQRVVPSIKTRDNYHWQIRSSRINIIILKLSYGFMLQICFNDNNINPIYTLSITEEKQNYHYCLLKNYLVGLPIILEYDLINEIEYL